MPVIKGFETLKNQFALCRGLGIVPIVFALPVAHWSEWVAALAGGAAGWVIGQASRRSRGSRGALPEFRT